MILRVEPIPSGIGSFFLKFQFVGAFDVTVGRGLAPAEIQKNQR